MAALSKDAGEIILPLLDIKRSIPVFIQIFLKLLNFFFLKLFYQGQIGLWHQIIILTVEIFGSYFVGMQWRIRFTVQIQL